MLSEYAAITKPYTREEIFAAIEGPSNAEWFDDGERQHFERLLATVDAMAAAEKRLAYAELGAAEMRRLLKHVQPGNCCRPDMSDGMIRHDDKCQYAAAISSDVGKELLEELEGLRIKLKLVEEPVYSRRKLEAENARLREAIEWILPALRGSHARELRKLAGM